jgi:hypothetical protein
MRQMPPHLLRWCARYALKIFNLRVLVRWLVACRVLSGEGGCNMALVEAKSGRIPRATAPVHHLHHLATEIRVWAPVLALGALTLVAGIILWLRVTGY